MWDIGMTYFGHSSEKSVKSKKGVALGAGKKSIMVRYKVSSQYSKVEGCCWAM